MNPNDNSQNPNRNSQISNGSSQNPNRSKARGTRGIADAVDLMMEMYKGEKINRSIRGSSKSKEQISQNEAQMRMSSQGSSSQGLFQSQRNDISISQRVKEASESHLRQIENISNASQRSSVQSSEIKIFPVNSQLSNQVSVQNDKKENQEKKPQEIDIFGKNNTTTTNPVNVPSNTQPSNIIFGHTNNNNVTFSAKPGINIFSQQPQQSTVNPQNEPEKVEIKNIFGQKPVVDISQPINKGLFANDSQFTSQSNLLAEKKETQLSTQAQQSLFTKPVQQEKPKEEEKPEKKVNIFAEGLFEENSKKPKPVLVFNNNLKVEPESDKKEKPSTPGNEPVIKLLFNNNGAVVENIKPQVNIFGGAQSIQENTESQITSSVMSEKTVTVKSVVFEPPKEEVQIPSQNALFENPNQESQQWPRVITLKEFFTMDLNNPPAPKKELISNPIQEKKIESNKPSTKKAPFTKSQGIELFSIKEISPENESSIPKPSLFGNNNSSNLFSQPEVQQKEEKTQNIFARQEVKTPVQPAPLKDEKAQPINIFGSQSNNVFGTKLEPENKPTPTGGLFSNNQATNIFSQPKQENSIFSKSNNDKKAEDSKQQQPSQKYNPFQKSLKGDNMFSQPQSVSKNTPTSQNIFGSTISQNNLFAQSSQNMFAQSSQNMFQQKPGGGSLFGNSQNDNVKRGAALFGSQEENKEEEVSDDDGEGEKEGDDGLVHSNYADIDNGEMKYDNYLKTSEFAKAEALKFKSVLSSGQLLDRMKLSIERIEGDNQIYVIVRTPNKLTRYLGIVHFNTLLKKKEDTDSEITIIIQNLIQIDLNNNNNRSREEWRIKFPKSEASINFVKQLEKLIEEDKKKQQKSN